MSEFTWIDDFSAARNFNFSQAKTDWIVWGDSDDEIEGLERAKDYLKLLPPIVQAVICTYNYSFTGNGTVGTQHPKERFIRNNGLSEWKGRLHESCITPEVTPCSRFDDIIWNHRTDSNRFKDSTERNVRIIEKEMADQIEGGKVDPRTVFNLGMAYASIAQNSGQKEDWERTLSAFFKYLQMGEWDQHIYMAWKYAGICHMNLNNPALAVGAFKEAVMIEPNYADGLSMMGSAYQALGDDSKAEKWYLLALGAGKLNSYASDIETSKLTPLYSLATIEAKRGKLDKANEYLDEIEKLTGDDKMTSTLRAEIERVDAFIKHSESAIEQIEKLPEDEQKAAYDALPPDLKSSIRVSLYRKSKNWKKETSGKEITIFGTSWEEWNPDSAKTGIGGSEEATIYLTRELKKLGWDVHVYGMHGEVAKEYDGVWYHPWWDWSPKEPTDIFISWRDPNLFEYEINAKKKYCWLHDTNPKESFTPKRLANIDKVIVLSKYHRSLYPNIPDSQILLSSNGIIPEHFALEVERNPKKVLYTSAPNRGLECLLKMWPEVKKQVPEAELYWAYGWDTFDKMQKNNPNAVKYKEKIVSLLNQPGVTDLGRIGHEELAKHMLSAGVWTYPTEFTEIFPVHGDTLIETSKGQVPIKDLAGKNDIFVYSWNEKKREIELSKVNWCGMTRKNAEVVKIKMKYGVGKNAKKECELILTPDHPVMMRDGSWKEAKAIKAGDRVMPMNRVKNGWGNGYDLLVAGYEYEDGAHRIACRYHTGDLSDCDIDHIDGDVTNNDPSNLQALSRSSHWKKTWSVLPSDKRKKWGDRVRSNLDKYHASLGESLSDVKRKAAQSRWDKVKALGDNHVVLSVENFGKADVYCMEVEPNHNFVANSVVVHNCITAVKMQAAGCIPVCTNVAALDEVVQYGHKFDIQDMYSNKEAQEKFIEKIVSSMNETDRAEMMKWARETWGWDVVAKQWSDEFLG